MEKKTLEINGKRYVLLDEEYRDEQMCVFLAINDNINYHIKNFVDFVTFNNYVSTHKKLVSSGVNLPKILVKDDKNKIVIEEVIMAPSIMDELLEHSLTDSYFKQLFFIYRIARNLKLKLDYRPDSFIIKQSTLIYIKHNILKSDDNSTLENETIRLWFYGMEFYNYCIKLGKKPDTRRVIPENEINKQVVLLTLDNW